MPLRLVFCGTPVFALPSLQRLLEQPHFEVAAVVTQPDRPRGRGQELAASPVKEFALLKNLRVEQPEQIRSDSAFEIFEQIAPDAVVIIAYGQIVPQRLLDIPRLGWINLHASLLPKYRGAAPINWAIINGDSYSGITTMLVNAGMDTGPILMQQRLEIGRDETAPQLGERMAHAGAPLVMNTLVGLENGTLLPNPQNNAQATRAPLLKKEFGLIDWRFPARQIYNRIRGLQPWPGTFTYFRGQSCRVWGKPAEYPPSAPPTAPGITLFDDEKLHVSCGDRSWLEVTELQLEGRKRVTAAEFAHGAHLIPGEAFSASPS